MVGMDYEDAYDSEDYDGTENFAKEHGCVEKGNNSGATGQRKCYSILSFEDIHERQQKAMECLSGLCYISKSEASIVLRHFKWDVSRAVDEWFANEQKLRRDSGLPERISIKEFRADEHLNCRICMDYHNPNEMKALACSHYFCKQCWRKYIQISIRENGIACLALKCPQPKCDAIVGEDTVHSLITGEEDIRKYGKYLVRSYVEGNKWVKWCPAPECEYAVELIGGSTEYHDATCKCSHNFCWNCSEEIHRPVDCETVRKWMLKNCDDAESENWKLVNTKPCPKCDVAIEKNQGCMHMRCVAPCCYEFCWLCLGDWTKHGGDRACNRFEGDEVWAGISLPWQESESEKTKREEKEAIKNELQRYIHYYERWAANEQSRAKTVLDLHHVRTVQIGKLRDKLSLSEIHPQFVADAWLQIVECRRVLKWTYAYGHYLPDQDEVANGRKHLFEHSQAYAESSLERLHQCAEEEMQNFLERDKSGKEFNDFRIKLANLTNVARQYFGNLVNALEGGNTEYK